MVKYRPFKHCLKIKSRESILLSSSIHLQSSDKFHYINDNFPIYSNYNNISIYKNRGISLNGSIVFPNTLSNNNDFQTLFSQTVDINICNRTDLKQDSLLENKNTININNKNLIKKIINNNKNKKLYMP